MSANEVKVSVCVVTYNQEQYIAQCLQSLVDQETNFNFEVIVSDDCSTDKTTEIIKDFQKRYPDIIKPIFHKKNIGAFENFLFVHNQAKGEYVAHMDGDDYWLQGKLVYQVDLLDKNPDIVQCWTCAYLVNNEGNKVGIFPSKSSRLIYPEIIQTKDIALSYALVGHHSTQMYRRSARKLELLKGPFLDYWVAFVNSLEGKSFYSKEILSFYRIGSIDSLTRHQSRKRVTVDLLSIHLKKIIDDHPQFSSEAKANMITRFLISKMRGHELSIIKENLKLIKHIRVSYFLILKSFIYFILQKLP